MAIYIKTKIIGEKVNYWDKNFCLKKCPGLKLFIIKSKNSKNLLPSLGRCIRITNGTLTPGP